MAEPVLALRGVTKRFGRVQVCDELHLDVASGEALGIIGPNGAGKTSLFSLISGDLRPDDGTVALFGRDVTHASPAARCRLGLGRTYQVPRPFEHMTVFENVLVAVQQGAGLGGHDSAQRTVQVLQRLGLAHAPNTLAGRLSLLDRKRLEVARALGTGPRLLLLDEVAGGLTGPEVAELVTIIRSLHAEGLAVVWIEHVVHALTGTVDRLICLADGAVIADGDPREVLATQAVREVYLGGGFESLTSSPGPGPDGPGTAAVTS